MKKIMIIIFTILLAGMVNAFYGSETITVTEDIACDELIVKVSVEPSQDEGEYILEPDCTEVSFTDNLKTFRCLCTNFSTTITLTPELNSAGEYSFEIEQYEAVETYEQSNNGTENITSKIKLPNDVVIERVIQPDEELVYVETSKGYVIVPESNVTLKSVTSDDENIRIVAVSFGYKCFDIYSENGQPYSVTVNGDSISFDYENNLINFCTTFSTKEIDITWEEPEVATTSSSGGGSSGGGGTVTRRLIVNEPQSMFLLKNTFSNIYVNNVRHTLKITDIFEDSVLVEFESLPIVEFAFFDKYTFIDFDVDGISDLRLKLLEIRGNFARIELTQVKMGTTDAPTGVPITEEEEPEITFGDITSEETIPETVEKESNKVAITITVIVILLAIAGIIIYSALKKKKEKKKKE